MQKAAATAVKWLVATGVCLALASVLVAFEWPLPKMVQARLKEFLARKEVTLEYERATFDLGGHVRLWNVRGRWQGLLEVEARQVLLGLLDPAGIDLTVDEGVLHTEYLLLPIPEKIEVEGTVQLQKKSILVRSARLKAFPVVAQISGVWKYPETAAVSAGGTEIVDGATKMWAAVGGLLRLSSGWVVEVSGGVEAIGVRAWGESFISKGIKYDSPKIFYGYPQQTFVAGAQKIETEWGRVEMPSVVYRKDFGSLWLASCGRGYLPKGGFVGAVAQARLPMGQLVELATAKDLEGRVFFEEGAARFFNVSQEPLGADFTLRAKGDWLEMFGVHAQTKDLFFGQGHLTPQGVEYALSSGEGAFYEYPYKHLVGWGHLNKDGIGVDRWWMSSADGAARGDLNFEFASRRVKYHIAGELQPYHLPWFGAWWQKAFEPFKNMKTAAAIYLENAPGVPVVASGVVGADNFGYKTLPVERATFGFVSQKGNTFGEFAMRTGAESAEGKISWTPQMELSLAGRVTPLSLAKAYFDEVPKVLEALSFEELPMTTAQQKNGQWQVAVETAKPVGFYTLNLDYAKAKVRGDGVSTVIDPLEFGFAHGAGRAQVVMGEGGKGSGSLIITGADLGEWSMLGKLGSRLKGSIFGFSSLKLRDAKADFVITPDRVEVPQLEMVGDEHAVAAVGSLYPNEGTMDFKVRLKTLGGQKAALGILALIVQPLTSVVEAHLSGPMAKPEWKVGFTAPSLMLP